jgi:glycosyltransferase involved in cell wall biosynthesis
MPPRLSVVLGSLNGATRLDRCLRALAAQTIRSSLELIVVDDGSTDSTSDVARAHGVVVLRHPTNRGVSAARNTGVSAASAPFVAFVDDDCEPDPQWAEQLLTGYEEDVVAVAGELVVGGSAGRGIMLSFLARHNPLAPQELDLVKSDRLHYRFYIYLQRQWKPAKESGRRDIFACASANMSVRRRAFLAIGGFDERIRFGSEDEDLCRRLRREYPTKRLVFVPQARVYHHFKPSLPDTLRRRRSYGRGSALMYRKWPNVQPTFFPGPAVILGILVCSIRYPVLIVAAVLLPYLFYPQGLRAALAGRSVQYLLDPYLELAQEGSDDIGFLEGMWRFRNFVPEPASSARQQVDPHQRAGSSLSFLYISVASKLIEAASKIGLTSAWPAPKRLLQQQI